MYKLSRYGITGSTWNGIKAFLVNRVQSVNVNSCVSTPVTVTSGVPQGPVLGPLLFLCHSADLTDSVKHSKFNMFADDTKLYNGIHTMQDCYLLQEDLNCVSHWGRYLAKWN